MVGVDGFVHIGDEAFTVHDGGIVTVNPNVPIRVGQVVVDPISIGTDETHLLEALQRAPVSGGIPILPIEALVYMKLKSPRRKDTADVVELVKAGVDTAKIEDYLIRYAPSLSPKFKTLISEAERE